MTDPTPVPQPHQPTRPIGGPGARPGAEEPLAFPLAGFPGRAPAAAPETSPPPRRPATPPAPPAAGPPNPIATSSAYAEERAPRSFVPPLEAFDLPPRRRSPLLPAAVAIAVVVVVAGLVWLLWPSSSTPAASETSSTTTTAPSTAADRARLDALLPAGYPAGVCSPVDAPAGALAKVRCGRNAEPDGPDSATYTLAADIDSLRTLFDSATHGGVIVVCPGNIQSPGAWRRNSTPGQEAGVLVCGLPGNTPTVAWTDNDHLLLSVTQSNGAPSSTLAKLYTWWSSHS